MIEIITLYRVAFTHSSTGIPLGQSWTELVWNDQQSRQTIPLQEIRAGFFWRRRLHWNQKKIGWQGK
jgi:hypothetical protein